MEELIMSFFCLGFRWMWNSDLHCTQMLFFFPPENGWFCNDESRENNYLGERSVPFSIPLAWSAVILLGPESVPVSWPSMLLMRGCTSHSQLECFNEMNSIDIAVWLNAIQMWSFLGMCMRRDTWANPRKAENTLDVGHNMLWGMVGGGSVALRRLWAFATRLWTQAVTTSLCLEEEEEDCSSR